MPTTLNTRRIQKVSRKRDDNGVAEVVGAVLLFAVVISLFTSFMVWYIPAQTTNNEVHYELQAKSSLGNLVSAMHADAPPQGSVISENIALGISGVSFFSSPQSTEFSILPQSTGYNSTVTFSVALNVTSTGGQTSTKYFNATYNSTGILSTNGNTEYITQISYLVEDGTLFQYYGTSQPANSLGPLPLGIVNNSGTYAVNVQMYNISGQSEVYSSTQPQVINLQVNNGTYSTYTNNSLTTFGGVQYTVNRITLESLDYHINSSLVNAWDYGFFGQYNSSLSSYQNVVALSAWNFGSSPFTATVSGSDFGVSSNAPMILSSFSTQYIALVGL